MRFISFKSGDRRGVAVAQASEPLAFTGLLSDAAGYPGDLEQLVRRGAEALAEAGRALAGAPAVDLAKVQLLPPLENPPKIICLGLNYADHAKEGGFEPPTYPTVFGRFNSSLVAHEAPLVCPAVSTQYDYEGEMVAVIGKAGRRIGKDQALSHVIAYSVFNDASVRDYQFKSPQWTMGKNFDGTGAFGPWLVTADELPAGATGLRLQTRLNGEVVQDANTDDLIFDVATTVALLSEAFTLEAGDVIVTGTPAGVGFARKPQLFMKPGDVCEVEVQGIGILRNTVTAE